MKSFPVLSLFFLIQLFTFSCVTYQYSFINSTGKAIAVRNATKGKEIGLLNPGDSVKTISIGAVTFKAAGNDFNGSISFKKVTDLSVDLISYKEENAELLKSFPKSPLRAVEGYLVNFGGQPIKVQSMDKYGVLRLTSNQDNVQIIVDNELVGTLNKSSPFNKKVSAGNHLIQAKKEFFMPVSINMEMKDKEVFEYDFQLLDAQGYTEDQVQRSVTRQAKGDLVVISERTDYQVQIIGLGVFKDPPFELKNFPAGKYTLRVTCPEFTKDLDVTVPDQGIEFVDLDLIYSRE